MKNKFNIGDLVKSHFRANWTGKIIEIDKNEENICYLVEIIKDRHGNPFKGPNKDKIHLISEGWLYKI